MSIQFKSISSLTLLVLLGLSLVSTAEADTDRNMRLANNQIACYDLVYVRE
jgi:hypothetical protein